MWIFAADASQAGFIDVDECRLMVREILTHEKARLSHEILGAVIAADPSLTKAKVWI